MEVAMNKIASVSELQYAKEKKLFGVLGVSFMLVYGIFKAATLEALLPTTMAAVFYVPLWALCGIIASNVGLFFYNAVKQPGKDAIGYWGKGCVGLILGIIYVPLSHFF